MNKKQALEALKYNAEYIEEIHHINSNALVAIVEKDVAKLKELKEDIELLCENWAYYPDSPNKLEYYKAIKYFIKELEKGVNYDVGRTVRKSERDGMFDLS